MSPSCHAVPVVLCVLLFGSGGVFAQPLSSPASVSQTVQPSSPALPAEMAPLVPVLHRKAMDDTDALPARLLTSADSPRENTLDPHFGRALFGSTLGAGIGTGLGLLLLNEASRINDENERTPGRSTTEEEAASIAGMIGIVCIVAGGPFGAVQMGRIERRRNDAYVGAAVGEFVFGALGYVAANRLGGNSSSRLAGLGVGVAVGSAAGAVLVASQQQKQRGLFRRDNGNWTVAPPSVRVQPNLSSRRSPSVHVSLLSLRW